MNTKKINKGTIKKILFYQIKIMLGLSDYSFTNTSMTITQVCPL